MDRKNSIELLRRLSLAAGPPGAEDDVRRIVCETLHGIGRISHDRLGSLLCEKRGAAASPRVMLDSHLDEVGFMVQSVSAEGKLGFVPLGGWWEHVLLGQRVDVLTEEGPVPGVIGSKPPHFLSPEERRNVVKIEAMYIDVGASDAAQVGGLGVRVGDMVVPRSEFVEMGVAGVVGSKALDNRVGVALMCEALCEMSRREHPNTIIGVGAVQEEIGARGAATASHVARPDVALVLECTPADDLPGQQDRQAVLGRGPQLRHFDPTAVSNRRLVRFVEQVAAEQGLPLQLAVRRGGGTDAGAIHRSLGGVPTVVLGVPGRYIHGHFSLLHLDDYVAALRLVVEVLARLDQEQVDRCTRFD